MEENINGYPKYHITNDGKLFSIKQGKVWKELKPSLSRGYNRFVLYDENGQDKKFFAHKLVLLAYIGKPPDNMPVCRHLDGNRQNNNVSNLKWGTHKQNSNDMILHGRSLKGEKNHNTILNEESVHKIFSLVADGFSFEKIAKMYKCSATNISNITYREIWGHIDIDPEIENKAKEVLRGKERLSEEKLEELIDYANLNGLNYGDMQEKFGLSRSAIFCALKGKSWKHVKRSIKVEIPTINNFSDEDILNIFKMRKEGYQQKEIAAKFSVRQNFISRILSRIRYGSVPIPEELLPEKLPPKKRKRINKPYDDTPSNKSAEINP